MKAFSSNSSNSLTQNMYVQRPDLVSAIDRWQLDMVEPVYKGHLRDRVQWLL